jgi:hypothetical protein
MSFHLIDEDTAKLCLEGLEALGRADVARGGGRDFLFERRLEKAQAALGPQQSTGSQKFLRKLNWAIALYAAGHPHKHITAETGLEHSASWIGYCRAMGMPVGKRKLGKSNDWEIEPAHPPVEVTHAQLTEIERRWRAGAPAAERMAPQYRTGRSQDSTVYENDKLIGSVFPASAAKRLVDNANKGAQHG